MSDNLPLTHHTAELAGVDLHYVRAGTGEREPVLLVHGWPETWYAWRHVIPLLADHDLVVPDLRGLGDSSVPASGYDKLTLAGDLRELLTDHLGLDRFHVVGHDWGGVVAFYTASLLRAQTISLAMLDVTVPSEPGPAGSGPDFGQGGKRWHHGFLQAPDLPETLFRGHEREFYQWFWTHYGHRPDAVDAATAEVYLRSYCSPDRFAAGLQFYRQISADKRNAAAVAADPLTMPVITFGGAHGFGRRLEPLESLQGFATDVEGVVVEECGHWIPEEQPAFLAAKLRSFFDAALARDPAAIRADATAASPRG